MKLQLQEILYHLNVEGDISYLKQLLEHEEVKEIILNAHNRHKCKTKILKQLLLDYVIHEYEYTEVWMTERFKNGAKKWLGQKAREIEIGNGQKEKENLVY